MTAQGFWLSGPERDDAANRIVRGHTDGDAIAWHHLDSESAHPAAQLREHFVARIALDSVQPAGMDCDDGPLHVDQIVFTQYSSFQADVWVLAT